jgi:predicted ATPase with chaperone activity
MSSTRRADPNAPLSQERYMSSLEFADLRAISGTAVARRCALLASPAKRHLLWFIQAMSLAEGGLKKLT